jgi:hypothetical protein
MASWVWWTQHPPTGPGYARWEPRSLFLPHRQAAIAPRIEKLSTKSI